MDKVDQYPVASAAELHPAQRVLVGKTDSQVAELIRKGVGSPYPLEDDDVHLRPTQIRGRIGASTLRGHFTGYVNSETGKLRVDHTGDHAFWLELDLNKLVKGYVAHKWRAGGPAAEALAASNASSFE